MTDQVAEAVLEVKWRGTEVKLTASGPDAAWLLSQLPWSQLMTKQATTPGTAAMIAEQQARAGNGTGEFDGDPRRVRTTTGASRSSTTTGAATS